MRVPVRSLATLVFAVGVATCADAPTVGRARTSATTSGARGRGTIAMSPVFSQTAAAVYAQRATFAGASFDHVRIVLVRPGPPADTLRDTTIVFTPGSAPQSVEFTVDVAAANEAFTGAFDYTNNGQVVYHGSTTVIAHGLDEPAPPQQAVVITYVGPGANVTRLVVAPKTVTVVAPGSATFTATGFDASNAPVANNPVSWSVSDPTVATISAAGVLSTTGKRGVVTVSATSIAGPSDAASATVTLPPAAIALVSGGAQTGKAGAALPQSVSVKVTATDGVGVAGVTVNFAPPSGGAVGSSSVTTDQNGIATTSLTLGGAVGPQSFAAVAGTFSVSIPATATPGDASSVVAVSGSGQQDTVKKAVGALVVKVTDKFANAVPGVTVSWARTEGTGSLSGSSSVTGADGTASIGYTLGTTPGVETITASVSGVTGAASFSVTALPAGPTAIASVGGGGQSGRVQQPLPAPFVVKVTDASGNGLAGVSVSWSATNGTISPTTTTDANGQSSNTLTLGATLGNASATATIGSGTTAKSVTFTVTVQAGIVAQIAFRTGPPATVGAGAVLAPPIAIELRDAAGNLTAAANAVSIALGANPGQATLGGTLTVNAVGGVATFNDLTVSAAGNGYTLVASSAGVPNVASAAFNITGAGGDTWTGAVSTDWFTAGNWSAGVPTATTNVVIPAGTQNAPTSNSNTSINDLTVAAGATLTVGGEATMIVAGNVVASGNVSNTGGELRMTGAGKTVRGNFSYLSIAGTVSISGPLTLSSGLNMSTAGANFTVNTTAVALGHISIGPGQLTIATGAAATATSIFIYSSGVFSQTGGTLTVSSDATFGGGATTGLITGGTLSVGGNFAQQAATSTVSFVATGTHRTILASAGVKTVTFESPAASGFRDIEIDGPGALTLGSTVTATGALISPAGATPIIGGGNQLIVSGLNVDGMTIDNGTIVSNGGTITKFDNVTFQNYPVTATPLTITHPGAATAFTFNTTQFLVTPTSGRYLSVTDANPNDGQVLTINLVNSTPADGSAQTAKSGGAVVIWQSGTLGTWAGTVSTDWFAAGNWGGNAIPTASTNVTIPAGVPNMPVLTANAAAANVTVAPNASISLGSFTLTTGGNVDGGTGPGITGAGALVMTGPSMTFRGAVSNLSVNGTISLSGAGAVTGNVSLVSGGTFTVNQALTVAGSLSASGASSAALATIVIAQGAAASAGSLSTSGASGIFSQTGGSLTVSGAATFGGNNVGNVITAGTLVVGGDFTQTGNVTTASFAATGTHLVVLTGTQTQNVNFANPPSSHFQNLSLSNSGTVVITTTGGALSVTGQLISPAGATAVQSAGRSIAAAGLDVDGLTLDNTTITSTGGTIAKFDNVTFQNYAATATPLTITHPGAATGFTFNNTQFLVTPTSGYYMNVTDSNPNDGQPLTITMLNSAPADGSAQTALAGGAHVNWQTSGAAIAWTNASGGSWSLASNWSLGRVPGPGDSVVIALSGTYTVTLDTTYLAKSIVVGAATGTQTLSISSRTLTVSNFLTTLANGVFNPIGSTVAGSGTVRNQGTLRMNSGTIAAALINQGTILVGGSSNITASLTTQQGSIIRLQGDNIVGNAFLTLATGFTNNGGIELTTLNQAFSIGLTVTSGTLVNAAGATITSIAGTGGTRSMNLQLDNQGSFVVQQPVTMGRASSVITNSGAIDLTASDLTVSQFSTAPISFTNTGTITIGAGHTFTVSGGVFNQNAGSIAGAGTLSLQSVTSANFATGFTNATTAVVLSSTTVSTGTLTNAPGKTLNFLNSTIAASAALDNQGTLVVGGSNTINGALTTTQGSILRLQGDNTVGNAFLTTANGFTNNGAIELTTLNQAFSIGLTVTNGTLVNVAGATITSIVGSGGTRSMNLQLDNQGSFVVQQPVTMGRASSVITNSGAIDLTASDLTVSQFSTAPISFTNTGTITIGAGHTFTVTGGVFNQNAGSIAGPGTLSLQSVTSANFASGFTNATTALVMSSTTVTTGTVTNAPGKTLNLVNSIIGPSAALDNQGTLVVGGSSTINGALTTAPGSILRLQGDNTVGNAFLTTASGFTNNGAIELTTLNQAFSIGLTVTNGVLTNAAGATITSIAGTGGTRSMNLQLDNQGTFVVQQPVTMGRASSVITNSGTIDLTAGDLSVSQFSTAPISFTNTGTITIGAGHTFTVTGGVFNQNAGSIAGAGTLSLQSVTSANFASGFTNATTALVMSSTTVSTGTLTNATGKTLNFVNSIIGPSAALDNQGTLVVGGSSTINGLLTTSGGSILRLQGDNTVGNAFLTTANGFTNNGAIQLTTLNQTFSVGLTITSGTLVNVSSASITSLVGAGGSRSMNLQLDNQGAFVVQQPVTMGRASSVITNSGTIDLTAADLSVSQFSTAPISFTNTGTITIGAGHTFTVTGGVFNQNAGSIAGAGTLSLQSVTAANFATDFTNANTALIVSSTTVNGPGIVTNAGGKTLALNNSVLGANGTLVNQGTMSIGGSSTINGTLTTASGSVLLLQGDNSVGNSFLTINTANGFTNNGTIQMTTLNQPFTVSLTLTSGVLTNAAGATIITQVGAGGGRNLNAQLDNQGTLTVQQPLTMARASSVITNSGTIDLTAGDMTVNQFSTAPISFTNSGAITIGAGHSFQVTGGTFTQQAGTLSGAGTLALNSVTAAAFNTSFTVAGLSLTSSTASFAQNLSSNTLTLTASSSTINGPGTITNTAGQTMTLIGTTIGASSGLSNQGTLILGGGNTIAGPLTTAVGSDIQLVSNNSFGNSSLTVNTAAQGFTNNGTIELTTQNQPFTTSLTVTNGTLTNAAGATITVLAGSGGGRNLNAQLDNQGSLIVQQPMTMARASSVITNSGTIDLTAGDLTVNQFSTSPISFTNTGTIPIGAGHTLSVVGGTFTQQSGTLSGAGTLSLNAVTAAAFNTALGVAALSLTSTTASFAQNLSTATLALTTSSSTINGPGTLTNAAGHTLTLNGSTIGANSALDNQGTLIIGAGNTINGGFTTASTSDIQILSNNTFGNSTLTVNTATGFTNSGTIEMTTANQPFTTSLTVNNGTLTNAAGATITTQVGALGSRNITASLDNQGTINVQQAVSMNRNASTYTNSGTITVGANLTHSLNAGTFTNSGVITVAPGVTWTIVGGTFTHQAAGSVSGAGIVALNGVTATINSGFTAGILNLTGNSNVTLGAALSTATTALVTTNATINGNVTITNPSTVTTTLNTTTLGAGITWLNQGTLITLNGSAINGTLTTVAGSTLRVDATSGAANLTFGAGTGFTNNGAVELVGGASTATITTNAGTLTNANGGTITGFVNGAGGRVIAGAVNNQAGGTINVSSSSGGTGTMSITGAGGFTNSGTVNVRLNGTAAGQFDVLAVTNAATLGVGGPSGIMNVSLVSGFTPSTGNSFKVMTYASHSQSFLTTNFPPGAWTSATNAGDITLTAP